MIKAKNLTFSYRGKEQIFRDLSLSIEKGRICGLLGANGIGKSTLLKLSSGLLRPTEGSVTTFGHKAHERKQSMLAEIAYLPEEFSLPNISANKWVSVTAPFYPDFDYAFFREAVGEFQVDTTAKFGSLSMGQRKKVLIAFAIISAHRDFESIIFPPVFRFYNSILSLFFSFMSSFWNLMTSHIWVVFPFFVALVCVVITLILRLLFRVVNNG